MTKQLGILVGLLVLISVIIALFLRVQFLEEKQKAFASLPANAMTALQGNLPPVGKEDYVDGNKDSAVTLIEYSDFECPSCQRMHPVYEKIIKQFGNQIRFVQRMFPLPQNKNAEKEAEGALCAGKISGESMYWKYGDEIFKRTTGIEGGEGFPLEKLVPLARELGLPENTFQNCLSSGEMAQRVHAEKTGGENAGVSQLPTLFVIDKNHHVTVVTGEQSFATLHVIISYAIQE